MIIKYLLGLLFLLFAIQDGSQATSPYTTGKRQSKIKMEIENTTVTEKSLQTTSESPPRTTSGSPPRTTSGSPPRTTSESPPRTTSESPPRTTSESPARTISESLPKTTSNNIIRNKIILNHIQIRRENDYRGFHLECRVSLRHHGHHDAPQLIWLRNTVEVSGLYFRQLNKYTLMDSYGSWEIKSSLFANMPPFLPGSYVCQVKHTNDPSLVAHLDIPEFRYNETCTRDVDCNSDLTCDYHRYVCTCPSNQVLIPDKNVCKDASEYARPCERTEQCEYSDRNSMCYDFTHSCRCKIGFQPVRTDKIRCVPRTANIIKPARKFHQDIYKAALVALISFTVIVIGLFIYSLCTRSLMRRARAQTPLPIDDHYTSDVFNVTDGLAAMRNADKPPTYQEIVVQDQMLQGTPPPAYNEAVARNRNERLASILANMVINSQMEDLASRRGQSSSSETPSISEPGLNLADAPTRNNGTTGVPTTSNGSNTTRLIQTAGPCRSVDGISNPGFETDA